MANAPTAEVNAFHSNRTHLEDTLSHIVDLSWLGSQLCQEDFITSEKKANILTNAQGVRDKVSRFLDAVEIQVRNEPTRNWKAFITILSTQAALNHTVKRLESTLVEASSALGRKRERNNHLNEPTNKGKWLQANAPRLQEVRAHWRQACIVFLSVAFILVILGLVILGLAVAIRQYSSSCVSSDSQNITSLENKESSELHQEHGKQYKSDIVHNLLWKFQMYIREGKIDEVDHFVEQNISPLLANQTVTFENRELFEVSIVFFMKQSKLQQVIRTENKLIAYFNNSALTRMHDRCILTSLAAYEFSLHNYSRAAELSQLVSETLIKFKSSDHVYNTIAYWYIAIFSQFTMGKAMIASGRQEEGLAHINEAATLAFDLADSHRLGSVCGACLVSVICEYAPIMMRHGRCIWHILDRIFIGVVTLVNQTKIHHLVPDSQIVYRCACGESDPYGASIDPLKWDTSAVVPTAVHILYHSYWYLSMLDVIIPVFPINLKFLIKAFFHAFVCSIFLYFLLHSYFLSTIAVMFHHVRKLYFYVSCCRLFFPVIYIYKGISWLLFTCPSMLGKTMYMYSLSSMPLLLCCAYMYIIYCVFNISHLEKRKKKIIYKEFSGNGVLILLLFAIIGVVSRFLIFCCKVSLFKLSSFVIPLVKNSILWHFCEIRFVKSVNYFLVIITGQKVMYTVWLYSVFVGIAAMCYCEATYELLSGAAKRIDVVMIACIALLPFLRHYAFPKIATVVKSCFDF